MFKYLTKWWTVLITIGLFATLQVSNPDIVQSFKYSYYDFLQEQKEVVHSSDIILVNIDEKAIAKEGQYPWPRDIVAKYIDETPPDALYIPNQIDSDKTTD